MIKVVKALILSAGFFWLISCAQTQSSTKPDESASLRAENERLMAENQKLNSQIDTLNEKIMSMSAEASKNAELKEANAATYNELEKDLHDQISLNKAIVGQFEESINITFVSDIFFDEGSDVIKPEGKMALDSIVKTLSEVKNRLIRVEGYTDDVPIAPSYRWKFPSNWELSTARAGAVVRYLTDKGLDPGMFKTAGYSKYNPVASNDTPEGRAKNRRIVIELIPWDFRAKFK